MEQQQKLELRNKLYYFIIGLASVLFLTFVPMIGSDTNIGFNLPNTLPGWCIYVLSKICIAAINILIFYCFVQQSEVNVQDNEWYLKAKEILRLIKDEKYIPRSPKEFFGKQYRTKGITIGITSVASCVALGNAIITFDFISFLSYSLTVAMAILFGIITMKNDEVYWTNEFYQYALYMKEEFDGNQQHNCEQQECNHIGCTCHSNDNCGQPGV